MDRNLRQEARGVTPQVVAVLTAQRDESLSDEVKEDLIRMLLNEDPLAVIGSALTLLEVTLKALDKLLPGGAEAVLVAAGKVGST